MRRILEHPILKAKTARTIKFYFEDKELEALEGETIAAALIANGIDVFGESEHGRPRGFFCAIGKCSSCLMVVDGEPNVRVCITLVKEGMRVQRQLGRSDVA